MKSRLLRARGRSVLWFATTAGASVLLAAVVTNALLPQRVVAGPPLPSAAYARPIDEAGATKVLGQVLPAPAALTIGWKRTKLEIEPDDPQTAVAGTINQHFAIEDTYSALLSVRKGQWDPASLPGNKVDLAGVSVSVTSVTAPDGATWIGYWWDRHGLIYILHVRLSDRVDRSLADRIAASIP